MNKLKLLLMSVALMSFNSVAETRSGDWIFDDELKAYTSTDVVHGGAVGMLRINKEKELFGLFLPYDQCFVKEGYSEPLGQILVLGGYQDFRLQCLGKSKAVVYPQDEYVTTSIISSLIDNGNICLTVEETKICFSGNGVKELREIAKKS